MNQFVVIGDLNLDVIFSGIGAIPSPGKEILAESCTWKLGGSSANVATILAMMGCRVRLFSLVGRDAAGDLIMDRLRESGLPARTISRSQGATTGVTVSLALSGDRMYITQPGTLGETRLRDLKRRYIRRNAHLHLSSYYLQSGLRSSIGLLLKNAKASGMTTSLDPGCDPSERWSLDDLKAHFSLVDWFLPNADEIQAITGREKISDALQSLSSELRGVVVKAGSRGAYVRHGGSVSHFSAFPAKVVDTTCAGDCFDAGFLFGMASSGSVQKAAHLGNAIGALAVAHNGLPPRELVRKEVQG